MSQINGGGGGGGGTGIESITADAGILVLPNGVGSVNVLGGNNLTSTGTANTLTLDLTGTTDHAAQIGNAGGSLTSLAVAGNGELIIGSAGVDPAVASLTAPAAGITITGGAGTVTFALANDLLAAEGLAGTGFITRTAADTWADTSITQHSIIIGDAGELPANLGPLTNGQLVVGSTGAAPVAVALASADGSVGITLGAGTIDLSAEGVDRDNILYVGKHGNDANSGRTPSLAKLTIQSADTAAAAGDTIVVFPGTYTETVTHTANNVTVIANGKPNTCIITQADANVIDFATFTGIQYKYFGLSCTAATTAINTVQGSTGGCTFKECQLEMTCATDIAAAIQPAVGAITGAGELKITIGKVTYAHTGNGGATAQKGAFKVSNGGEITLQRINDCSIANSGTALVSGVGIDTDSTGVFLMNDNKITVTDPNSTVVVGLAYLGGTGTTHEFFRNTVHVNATNNIGYGFFSADTASTSRFFYNHLHVTDVAGSSYSYLIGNTATVVSQFDDIIAADGISLTAGGNFTCVSSEMDGDLTCRGREASGIVQANIMNMDNTATAGNAACNISVGGATSTGDPYSQWLITGSTAFSAGLDNSEDDAFKIGPNVNPSIGTSSLEIAAATGAITFSEAFTFPVADGGASLPLVTDGAGALTFSVLTVPGGGSGAATFTDGGVLLGSGAGVITATAQPTNGQLLIGSTGNDPVLGTLTDGNNITFSEGAGTITGNLTGTTDKTVQVGNAGGSLTSLAAATNGQLIIGSTGAAPAVAVLASADASVTITVGAGTIDLAAGGGGLTWTLTTANASIVAGNGYIANKAGLLTMTLPATATVGDSFAITNINTAVGFRISQNAAGYINYGIATTTVGAGGYLEATKLGDSIEFVCIATDDGWQAYTSFGNITIV